MTRDEHYLMIAMLAQQQKALRVFANILIAREILEKSDLDAFEAALLDDSATLQALADKTKQVYLESATTLKVSTGITGQPPIR